MAGSSPNRRPIYSDLNSYAQGYWTFFHNNVRPATGAPDDLMLACGVIIGFEDTEAPIIECIRRGRRLMNLPPSLTERLVGWLLNS